MIKRNFPDKGELKLALCSFFYFFCLMCGYFILRPVRDEMGIQAGIENMQWLFTGTFIAMLLLVPVFGWLMKKWKREKIVPAIYGFFVFNIIGFYAAFQLFDSLFIPVLFFIWLSVYNLFVVSIFWSFNSDIFSPGQAKRLYGPIAAGGSLGALAGPLLTTLLVSRIGLPNLLLVSAVLLGLSTLFILLILKIRKKAHTHTLSMPLGGSIWDGFRLFIRSPFLMHIGLFIVFYTTVSTFLYFEQARIIAAAYATAEDRTSYFGFRDLCVNSLTLFLQFLLTRGILQKAGMTFSLMLVPVFAAISFFVLGFSQTVIVILIVQVGYRTLNFAIQKPAREVLYTVMGVREKYKTKNFIDTTVYRGGDAIGGWFFAGLEALAMSLSSISFIAVPIALLWGVTGRKIGRIFNKQIHTNDQDDAEPIITKKSA